MRQLHSNAEGITALAQNIAYTSTSSGTFLRNGCAVTPNTTNTSTITVDVDDGSIALDGVGEPIDIASQSVELSPVPSNSDPDLTNARVDVINLTQNGASKVEGNVGVKRPTTADPYNDAVEGQWPSLLAPRPDDGGLVDGVGRAVVYVDETVADSTDITAADIRNYDAFGQDAIVPDTLNAEVEALPDPVDIEAQSAATFGDSHPNEYRRDLVSFAVPGTAQKFSGGEQHRTFLTLPPNHTFQLRRVTIMDVEASIEAPMEAAVVVRKGFGPVDIYRSQDIFAENTDGSPLGTGYGGDSFPTSIEFQLTNTGGQETGNLINATFSGDLIDHGFAP